MERQPFLINSTYKMRKIFTIQIVVIFFFTILSPTNAISAPKMVGSLSSGRDDAEDRRTVERPLRAAQYLEEDATVKLFPKRDLKEIPDICLNSARKALLKRVGFSFYKYCQMTAGRLTKRSFLAQESKDSEEQIYEIKYSLSVPKSPINAFPIFIRVDSEGNLIGRIQVPYLADNPKKIHVISLSDAQRITKNRFGIPNEKDLKASLIYNFHHDSFSWLVHTSLREPGENGLYFTPVLEIIADKPDKMIIQKWLLDEDSPEP